MTYFDLKKLLAKNHHEKYDKFLDKSKRKINVDFVY